MNLKSTGQPIDVFVCPSEPSLKESEDTVNGSSGTTAQLLGQKEGNTPNKVKKPDLDISLASTASYIESPPPQGIQNRVGDDTTLWSPSRDPLVDMESLLQLVPENDTNAVHYYHTLQSETEGLMDLFDIAPMNMP